MKNIISSLVKKGNKSKPNKLKRKGFETKIINRIGILCLSFLLAGCGELALDDTSLSGYDEMTSEKVGDGVEENKDLELSPETSKELVSEENTLGFYISGDILSYKGNDYNIIEVDGGDRSGSRSANVAVDIGFGDRIYWALTNEYGQLVYVLAENITLQNDDTEPVNADGRYYADEANVPGTEHTDLDQGHIIADSLGGVANAYNITPQDSTLNRYGDQAYMERGIREAGGCANFTAEIFYPDTSTQIPSSYKYVYTLMGNEIVDEFSNVNPEDYNTSTNEPETTPISTPIPDVEGEAIAPEINTDIFVVNGKNGKIHIQGECNATEEGSTSFMEEPISFSTYEEAEAQSKEIAPELENRNCGNCW